jgi:hypothetical protein
MENIVILIALFGLTLAISAWLAEPKDPDE